MQTTPERSVFSHRLKSPTTVLAFYCILTIIHPREYIEKLIWNEWRAVYNQIEVLEKLLPNILRDSLNESTKK